jgi:hypothetical protein
MNRITPFRIEWLSAKSCNPLTGPSLPHTANSAGGTFTRVCTDVSPRTPDPFLRLSPMCGSGAPGSLGYTVIGSPPSLKVAYASQAMGCRAHQLATSARFSLKPPYARRLFLFALLNKAPEMNAQITQSKYSRLVRRILGDCEVKLIGKILKNINISVAWRYREQS